MAKENPNSEQTPASEQTPVLESGSATALAEQPDNEKKEPKIITRIDPDRSKREFERKYAYWTWCPSRGHLYGGKFPGGEIVFSPITASEDKIIQQAGTGKDRMEIVEELVRRLLIKCPVAIDDLLHPDFLYILMAIRNVTYGSNYKFRIECQKCSVEYQHAVDVPESLKCRVLEEKDEGEPWETKLPMSGDTIRFKLLRLRDENDIRRWARDAYQRTVQTGDPSYVYRLSKHIVTINGEDRGPVKTLDYAEEMHGRDTQQIWTAIRKHDFGIGLLLDMTCPSCGHQVKRRMPFDREFFHPSYDEDSTG